MSKQGKTLIKEFFSYVIPSVVAQWVFALYSMVDALFVARGVSETALSAVNISSPFTTLLFSISLMFAVGTSTAVSIFMGQKKTQEANKAYTQNIVIVFLCSIAITAAVLFNLETVAYFLGATQTTISYVKEYVGTIAIFSSCFMVSYSFEILIKADGYPKLATIIVSSGAAANLILDALFVLVFKWGVFGAAFATGLSQLLVVILYLKHFLGKKCTMKLVRFQFDHRLLQKVMLSGASSGITELSAGVITFLMNHAIVRFLNDDALVSFSVISYFNYIIVMSMTGLAQGIQPLVSYQYGSLNLKTCEKFLKYGLITAAAASIVVFIGTWMGSDWIVQCFIPDKTSQLFQYSVSVFRIYSVSFLLVGYNVLLGGYFTAIDRAKSSIAISLGRGMIFLFISIEILPRLIGGQGVWWGAVMSEFLCLCMTIYLWLLYKKRDRVPSIQPSRI